MKVCPLCGNQQPEYWPNGDMKLDYQYLSSLRLFDYSIADIRWAIDFARSHGWISRDSQKENS